LVQVLKSAEEGGARLVLVDTPPRAEQAALAAAKAADLVLLPCRPAVFDLDTVSTTLDLIRFAGKQTVAAVLNGVPPRGSKAAQAAEIIASLGLLVCPTALGYRTAFADAGALGLTAQEYDPSGKAAGETEGVYKFMCKLLNSETIKGVNRDGAKTR
jgi:chromosome partitioning protein